MSNILKKYMNSLPFLPERIKIGKAEELMSNFYDETEYVVHIRIFKKPPNQGLQLKKVHRLIKFNQRA